MHGGVAGQLAHFTIRPPRRPPHHGDDLVDRQLTAPQRVDGHREFTGAFGDLDDLFRSGGGQPDFPGEVQLGAFHPRPGPRGAVGEHHHTGIDQSAVQGVQVAGGLVQHRVEIVLEGDGAA